MRRGTRTFSGLDNRLRDEIRDRTLALLKEENTSVLLVTHEPAQCEPKR